MRIKELKDSNPIKKILGITFGRRMFLIYLVGGLLPLMLIMSFLISGTREILVQQAEDTEMVELETIKRQLLEHQNILTTMSQYFYFDSKLEEIAQKNYTDYQEQVDDFKNYTAFLDYQKYYNNLISSISVFLENDTIKGNLDFVVVDEEEEAQEWYQRVTNKGGVVWTYLPHVVYGYDHALALTRMIKTKKGEDVGVLVIYMQMERLQEQTYEREGSFYITLNGETVLTEKSDSLSYEKIKDQLPDGSVEEWQGHLEIDGKECVVTCKNVKQAKTQDYLQIVSVKMLDDILREANRQNRKSFYLSIASMIFAVIIIMVTSYFFGKRIDRFREQMQKAAEGNFELEKKLGGNDEISQLYDYLGIMIYNIQKLLAEIYQEKLHAEQLKTKQKDAEFKMLTSQINPHFLYNTLETIRMKARVNKQYEIEELVKMLAKILRNNIRAGEKDVSIRSEMELVGYYLKIQQYRFGDRISYQIQMQEEIGDNMILPLILQPIVENSIIHGLEKKEEPGMITIAANAEGEDIQITVMDDGIGMEEDTLHTLRTEMNSMHLKGEHIGVCNVNHRIKLRYGKEYGITVESESGKYTKVVIRLPRV